VTRYISRLYQVGLVTKLDKLEPGLVMYEICNNNPRRLIAGFVFISARRPDLTDYREVDGSVMKRFAPFSTVKGGAKADRELKLDGFDRAIKQYHATLTITTGGASHEAGTNPEGQDDLSQ
jgi:hypothetical protein